MLAINAHADSFPPRRNFAQPIRRSQKRHFLRHRDATALNFFLRLRCIATVCEESDSQVANHQNTSAPAKSAHVADIRRMRDQQAVEIVVLKGCKQRSKTSLVVH